MQPQHQAGHAQRATQSPLAHLVQVACSDIQTTTLKQARVARAIAEDAELSVGIPMGDSLAPVPAQRATLVGPLKRFRWSITDESLIDPAV